ncbi:membrane protein DedA, SNARE-associated domain [Halobacillus alkaliphilus]|uniref:Membrane protein DedA, SNARE-associated domain n=1 Tax=Halobacillus alkaliphilus TaxID=396056 RepID=A0A1I2PEM9_9BACI|nr:DedA family protein [Halobacillus alkaliphilus]SFG14612.1 membrane protein DedA, SNARE-associated domain [Halobacillus alkaliphilus]
MADWITEFMSHYGYAGIFIMMAVENIFPPIPSEVILPFSGFMTQAANLSIAGVIVVSTTGSLAGAVVLYGIGSLMDVEKLESFVERHGHRLRIKKEDVRRVESWFQRYGIWAVLLGRMVPLVRSLISLPAGMANMKLSLFLLFTILGTLAWNTILILVGALMGESWNEISRLLEVYSTITYIGLGTGCALLAFIIIRKKILSA